MAETATSLNGGHIWRRQSPRDVQADIPAGDYVLLSASDTGIGMDQEVLDRAFEPFFTTKDIGKGSGLGLSQVHSFVTAAEGHIRVESAPGKGTTCHLYLPPSTQEEGAGRESEEPERAVRGGCETILVVKDDSGVLEVALKTIRGFGYDVVTAPNGR